MDLVNVSKGGLFDRTIVSPAIKRALKKRLGVKPDVKVGITHKEGADGKVSLYLDLEMHMTKSEYEKLKTFIETM